VFCYVQIINDIERTKNDIAAAEKRQQEIASQVQQAKQGKEDSVSTTAMLLDNNQTTQPATAGWRVSCLAG
jgi:hypothetical protein